MFTEASLAFVSDSWALLCDWSGVSGMCVSDGQGIVLSSDAHHRCSDSVCRRHWRGK